MRKTRALRWLCCPAWKRYNELYSLCNEFYVGKSGKTCIFTGSQLPIGDLRTDAKENLITSIQIAALQEKGVPVVQEVCLYFEYKLYRANRTTKINAEHFEAFASMNFPPLAESGVHLKVNKEYLLKPVKAKTLQVHKKLNTQVAIIKMFPGMSEATFNCILNSGSVKAVVLETYGSGMHLQKHGLQMPLPKLKKGEFLL